MTTLAGSRILIVLVLAALIAPLDASAESGTNPIVSVGQKKKPRAKLDQPIVIADGLEVIHYWFPDDPDQNEMRVFGLMRNTTEVALDSVPITFALYDADGNVLGAVTGLPLYHVIQPGQTMPFDGNVYEPPFEAGEIDRAEAGVNPCSTWGTTRSITEDGFGFDGLTIELKRPIGFDDGQLRIEGTVRNDGTQPAANVRVQATFYDDEGRYVGSEQAFVEAAIPAGKTGRFAVDARVGMSSQKRPLEYTAGNEFSLDVWAGRDSQVWGYC